MPVIKSHFREGLIVPGKLLNISSRSFGWSILITNALFDSYFLAAEASSQLKTINTKENLNNPAFKKCDGNVVSNSAFPT